MKLIMIINITANIDPFLDQAFRTSPSLSFKNEIELFKWADYITKHYSKYKTHLLMQGTVND